MALAPARLAPLAAALCLSAATGARAAPAAAGGGGHEVELRRSAAAFAALEKADVETMSRVLQQLVQDRTLLAPFLARDREALYDAARPSFDILRSVEQVSFWYFVDADRKCFLRVHKPEQFGDAIERDALKQAETTGEVASGKELGKNAFALRVVRPIRSEGKVVGYMELGQEIDQVFERMKKETGDDFGLLVSKAHVDRKVLARVRRDDRWDERPEVVLVNSTMWDEQRIQVGTTLAQLPAEGRFAPEWQDEGKRYVGAAFPWRNAANEVVGALFVRHRVDVPAPGKAPAAKPAK